MVRARVCATAIFVLGGTLYFLRFRYITLPLILYKCFQRHEGHTSAKCTSRYLTGVLGLA